MSKPEHFGKINAVSDFGAAVRAGRKAAGLRVVDACALAGVSIQTLTDIEAGKPTVGIGKMMAVADSLGIAFFSVSASNRHIVERELPKLISPDNGK
ncbi:MAG: helix-turn-helix transcriptional regulator [Oxalobacteraceae bacterium]|nr:helix-turn-helix transcriptional regulator [Oxalobacteraceae bacterium]